MTRNRRRRSRVATATPAEQARQIDHLVVMRESAQYDRLLMEGMIQQTLANVSHLPGADMLRAVGVEVFDDPDAVGGIARRVGRSSMAMVEIDGVLYLYSMGTAATDDLDDANAFVAELTSIIESYRPAHVWVTAFTRLLRSANYVGQLLKVFTEHTEVLHCEADIKCATPEGAMQFQTLGMIAALERDYIVRRHTAGRVAQWRRQGWIPNAHPPGYRIVDGRIELVPAEIEPTRAMLCILADLSLGPAQCAQKIGELGITTPMIERLHGEDATIADARNPSEVVTTLAGWVDAYETGVHETFWANPFPGVDHIAGVKVEEADGYQYGVLRFRQELPLPPGGWAADPGVFEAIRIRLESPSITGGASHRFAPPLAGLFEFDDGAHEFALRAEKGVYELVRRPLDPNRRFKGWYSERSDDVERLGRVPRVELHQSIADSIVSAVEHGLPAELDVHRFQPVGPLPRIDPSRARLRRLRRRLTDVERSYERAIRNARLAEDSEAAAVFVEDVARYTAEKKRLQSEITELESRLEHITLGTSFEATADLVAHAIAALAAAGGRADADLRNALRTIISRATWQLSGDEMRWELYVELPHAHGTVMLGPVTGKVAVSVPRGRDTRGISKAELRRCLIGLGLDPAAAGVAAACPHRALHEVLIAHLEGRPTPSGIDPDWAQHIVDTYTAPGFSWDRGKWRLADRERREVIEALRRAGGTLDRVSLIEQGFRSERLRYLSRHNKAPTGDPIVVASGRGATKRYELMQCPHCDGGLLTHSVVTPETKPGLLCTSCWRMPRYPSPVFPDFYRVT